MKSKRSIEYFKFGLIIAGILLLSYFFYSQTGIQGVSEYMRWLMGVFMTVFAAFKLVGYKTFASAFAEYDLIARRFGVYGQLFPFIQMSLGLLYLLDWLPLVREVAVVLVAGISAAGVFEAIYLRKSKARCACLGNVIKLPLSSVSLIEDVGMLAMAATMLTLAAV